jgi:hypothetical protein
MRSFWISVLFKDWTNPLDCEKRQMCQGSANAKSAAGTDRLLENPSHATSTVEFCSGQEARTWTVWSGLFARVKRKPASRSRIGSATKSQFCLSFTWQGYRCPQLFQNHIKVESTFFVHLGLEVAVPSRKGNRNAHILRFLSPSFYEYTLAPQKFFTWGRQHTE